MFRIHTHIGRLAAGACTLTLAFGLIATPAALAAMQGSAHQTQTTSYSALIVNDTNQTLKLVSLEHTPGSSFMVNPPSTLPPNWQGTVGVSSTDPGAGVAAIYENTTTGAAVQVKGEATSTAGGSYTFATANQLSVAGPDGYFSGVVLEHVNVIYTVTN